MYSIRDLLVCGPVVLAMSLLREASWGLILGSAVLLYGALRFLADLTGLEDAVWERRGARHAVTVAREAKPRSGGGEKP